MHSKRLTDIQLKKKLIPFEQAVLRFLKQHQLVGRSVLVACSGGADSLSLLFCLWRLRKVARLQVSAAYIHHGRGTVVQERYRERARQFVSDFCDVCGIPFWTNEKWPDHILKSEEELREFRQSELQRILDQHTGAVLFLAHHREDLIETQLLRLLRGTGLQGLCGFSPFDGKVARPYVGSESVDKKAILEYLKKFQVKCFEDPSNKSVEPLRNWLRQKWLLPLKKRDQGLYRSLARSLQNLAEAGHRQELPLSLIQNGRIDYAAFMTLTTEAKSALLAHYMREQNIRGYTATHVREILKRLDSGRREHNFRLLRRQWIVNAEHIFCEAGTRSGTLKSER